MILQTQPSIPEMFNEISFSYDKVNRILSFCLDKFWRNALIKWLPWKENLQLLDLATGTCDQLLALVKKSNHISYALGIDLAKEMLEIGKKKIASSPYAEKIELQLADAESLPLENKSFDCVTMSFGIRNVKNREKCLQEMFRVLSPGGRVLILEFSLPKNILIRPFYLLYLRVFLPFLGGLFSKNRKAYRYLNQSIEEFPSTDEFCSLMKASGFENIRAKKLTLGIVTLYIGDKL